jgi:dTDP-4-dehydrorhamnose 3,5-epimerase
MQFVETELPGVLTIELTLARDGRGFFARTFSAAEFAARDLCSAFVQHSISYNRTRGTLRGMHYQAAPHQETKLVRCTAGAAYDVLLDLRPGSATLGRWISVELTAENRRAVYVPPGVAHGFQTLTDGTELYYEISPAYAPESARGVRWNDPAFSIRWPDAVRIISDRDASFPDHRGDA